MVTFLHKLQQCLLSMALDGKDIVDVTPPDEGLDNGGSQDPLLQLGYEDARGGHPSAHGRFVDLYVVLLSKDKAGFVRISEIRVTRSAGGGCWMSLEFRAAAQAAILSWWGTLVCSDGTSRVTNRVSSGSWARD